MEMTAIDADINNEEEAVTLRSDFVNAGGGGEDFGEGDYEYDYD